MHSAGNQCKYRISQFRLWECLNYEFYHSPFKRDVGEGPRNKTKGNLFSMRFHTWWLRHFQLFSCIANIWGCNHCLATIAHTTWWCIADGPTITNIFKNIAKATENDLERNSFQHPQTFLFNTQAFRLVLIDTLQPIFFNLLRKLFVMTFSRQGPGDVKICRGPVSGEPYPKYRSGEYRSLYLDHASLTDIHSTYVTELIGDIPLFTFTHTHLYFTLYLLLLLLLLSFLLLSPVGLFGCGYSHHHLILSSHFYFVLVSTKKHAWEGE